MSIISKTKPTADASEELREVTSLHQRHHRLACAFSTTLNADKDQFDNLLVAHVRVAMCVRRWAS